MSLYQWVKKHRPADLSVQSNGQREVRPRELVQGHHSKDSSQMRMDDLDVQEIAQ
ncbi:MAG: hypothetical protein JSV27_10725 [Candidatus Bathyarchaeota archaeon]|nr:MAG: hypothetical protein JSV27_10725 [Candidatus Bathyarchaeota archaeon]